MSHHTLPPGFTPSSIDIPASFTGIVQSAPKGKPIISNDLTLSTPFYDDIVIRNMLVAINPCDWKMNWRFPSPGARVGCDLYGEVLAIGPEAQVRRPDIQIGDRVCGAVYGSNPSDHESGSFCDFVCAPADLMIRLPDGFEDGAGAALGGTSAATLRLALWNSLGLEGTPTNPLDPTKGTRHILVYGGSTATGTMALQLLRLYVSINTCECTIFSLQDIDPDTNPSPRAHHTTLTWSRVAVLRLPLTIIQALVQPTSRPTLGVVWVMSWTSSLMSLRRPSAMGPWVVLVAYIQPSKHRLTH